MYFGTQPSNTTFHSIPFRTISPVAFVVRWHGHPPPKYLNLIDFVVGVLTLPHRFNAVRGHRTGSNNSGAEDYLRRKTPKKQEIYTQKRNQMEYLKNKRVRSDFVCR